MRPMRTFSRWRSRVVAAGFVLAGGVHPLGAQVASARGGAIVERYSFDPGLGFESLDELSIPLVVTIPIAGRADVSVSGGWARVEMGLEDGTVLERSGLLDTEARLSVNLIPDRLRLLLSGSAPTGMGSVEEAEVLLLGPLSNDLLSFATPTLGAGGAIGAGLAGAAPVGGASLGYAVQARLPLSYEPVLGSDDEVRAGAEVRVRVGFERPVGRRGWVRAAGIYAVRRQDRLNGTEVNGVGNRFAGYASIDAPLGSAVATLWASGLYRSDPTVEATAVGAAFVPRGALLAVGGQAVVPLGSSTRLEPHIEYRTASAAPDAAGLSLEDVGDVVRAGLRVRRRMAAGLQLVGEGSGLWGTVRSGIVSAPTSGFRAGLFLEWSR